MKINSILSRLGDSMQPPVLIKENQSVRDIIQLMNYKHKKCAKDYDKIAAYFWAGTIKGTAKNLFDFAKKYIDYRVESEDLQTVSSPNAILKKRQGDCKHYSLFTAGVLDALTRHGIPIDWYYRFASYNPFDDTPGHVFVVIRQKGGPEIWVDPVLDEFDYHKSYQYAIDKKVNGSGISGIGRGYMSRNRKLGLSILTPGQCMGATGQQTGQLITKISASVAAIPVWPATAIIGAAGAVVGFFLTTFGSKYSSSTQVRWLDQLFEFYVMGNAGATSDNKVNEANVPNAQKWFAVVLGVPIYDRLRFNALAGKTGFQSVDASLDTRVKAYLNYPEVQKAGITYAQATEAAQIAGSLPLTNQAGAWRNQTAAPSLIDYGSSGLPSTAKGAGIFASMNPWIMFALIGAGLFFILSPKKHHYVRN